MVIGNEFESCNWRKKNKGCPKEENRKLKTSKQGCVKIGAISRANKYAANG